MMKSLLILIYVLPGVGCVPFRQTTMPAIRGVVIDAFDNMPIANVYVRITTIEPRSASMITDRNGHFFRAADIWHDWEPIFWPPEKNPPLQSKLILTRPGYSTFEMQKLTGNDINAVTIVMTRDRSTTSN